MTLSQNDAGDMGIAGDAAFPVNRGALCVKGWTAAAALNHPERLTTPLARDTGGELRPVSWDEALDRVINAIERDAGTTRQ